LTLAIVDDIGATLVIAVAYSKSVSLLALVLGVVGFGLILFFRWVGIRRVLPYGVVGVLIWLAILKSGVHPTVAGVALGLLTPARPWLGDRVPINVVTDLFKRLAGHRGEEESGHRREPVSPLERLETGLHPWVAFVVMPLFALANAGIPIELGALFRPVALAVAAGLVLGKPVGIVLFSWAAIRLGWARLPEEINGRILLGAGCLAGIGFTMSLFIASLALEGSDLTQAKIGILAGSTVSALLGSLLLVSFLPRVPSPPSRSS
jgi:NhaA family Na+:H+ antiporter